MVTQTKNLSLNLVGNNEQQDTWDEPINENFEKIDEAISDQAQLLSEAAGTKKNLVEFLNEGHNDDGSIKATPEVVGARNSFIFGDEDMDGEPVLLPGRINALDIEIFNQREGFASLREMVAFRAGNSNSVVSGAKNQNGYPTWCGFTGKNIQIDGSNEPIWMMINGKLGRTRSQKQVQVSNVPFGTKYLYAQLNDNGDILCSGTTAAAGADGTGGKTRIFQDTTVDFVEKGVRPGDVLVITNSSLARKYLIKDVSIDGNNNKIRIYGVFDAENANLSYQIIDTVALTYGYDESKVVGKFYVAEFDWDGFSVTALRTICFGDTFTGEWKSIEDVSTGTGVFNHSWEHNLFSDNLEISFHVSQANDGSKPIEKLSLSDVSNDIQVQASGSTASVTGGVYPTRSLMAQWTNKKVDVANPRPGVFYKDFNGVMQTTGFIRVVAKCLSKR